MFPENKRFPPNKLLGYNLEVVVVVFTYHCVPKFRVLTKITCCLGWLSKFDFHSHCPTHEKCLENIDFSSLKGLPSRDRKSPRACLHQYYLPPLVMDIAYNKVVCMYNLSVIRSAQKNGRHVVINPAVSKICSQTYPNSVRSK